MTIGFVYLVLLEGRDQGDIGVDEFDDSVVEFGDRLP